jgi:hypothetical protein
MLPINGRLGASSRTKPIRTIVRLKSMARPIDGQGRQAVVLNSMEISGSEKAETALPERNAQPRARRDIAPNGDLPHYC